MESNNLTEKLNTFTSLVLKDAEQKREKLLENVRIFQSVWTAVIHLLQWRQNVRE